MPREYLMGLFVITCIATLFSIRTTFLAWFRPEKLRNEIEGRARILTNAYPTTRFWRNASVNKIRTLTSLGFIFIVTMDFVLYRALLG